MGENNSFPAPDSLDTQDKILSAYYSVLRSSYLSYPENQAYLDYLHNNRSIFNIQSYFDVPKDPASVLSQWGLPEKVPGKCAS